MLAEIQRSPSHHGMRPTVFPRAGNLQCAVDLKPDRCRRQQGDQPGLVAEAELLANRNHRRRASRRAPLLPQHPPRRQIEARGETIVAPVAAKDLVPQPDHSPVMILKDPARQGVDLGDPHAGPPRFGLGVGGQAQQHAPGVVAIRRKDPVSVNHRSRNIRGPVADGVVRPEQAPVVGGDPHQPAPVQLHKLPDASPKAGNARGKRRPVAARRSHGGKPRLPHHGTGRLVERDQFGVGATRGADQAVTVDEGRFTITPARHQSSAKVAHQVAAPANLAGRGVEAGELSIGPEGKQSRAIGGRCGTGIPRGCAQGGLPQQFAGPRLAGRDHHLPGFRPQGEDSSALHHHAAVPRPQPLQLPRKRRPAVGPGGQQSRLMRDSIPPRPPPLRPVFRTTGSALGQHGEQESRQPESRARCQSVIAQQPNHSPRRLVRKAFLHRFARRRRAVPVRGFHFG